MTKFNMLKKAILLSTVAVVSMAATAHAGFEWKGPLEPPRAAPEAAAPASDDLMPVTGVSPDAAPEAPVTSPEISVEPVQHETHAAPVQTAMSTAPAAAAQEAGTLSGFGSDLPLVIALQQIVPAGFQYSFSGGVNPGVTVSWQGGKPWQHVLSDTLAPQGLGYTLQNNTVIISRGAAPASAQPAALESHTHDSSMSPAPDMTAAPAASDSLAPVSITAQPPVTDAAPAAPAESVNIRREKPSSLLDRLGWRRGEERTEGAQPVISQPPAKTSNTYPAETSSAPGTAAPAVMSEPPQMTEPVAADAPAAAPAPVTSSSADAAFSNGAHMEMASAAKAPAAAPAGAVSTWSGGKGQTLRDVLKAWSDKAGVELYWSIDYDYRLATDAGFTGTYDEAVGGLLDKFASVRPQPYGQLHQSSSGPRVLVVKSYDLTR